MKFGKAYGLTIQVDDAGKPDNTVSLIYPQGAIDTGLTLTFSISRNVLASANAARIRITNLSEATRRRIYKDRFDTLTYRQVILRAGYRHEPKLPEIFRGNILAAYSYRQRTEWVTEIECYSGLWDILNTQTAFNLAAGFNIADAITQVLRSFKNVTVGAVGNFTGDTSGRGIAVAGNAWDQVNILADRQNGNAFIDNERAYVLKQDEYITDAGDVGATVISSDNGLLETPRRFEARLDVKVLFEPRIKMGQLITLKSAEPLYNRTYIVGGVNHDGTISPAVDNEVATVLNLLFTKSPKAVPTR